MKRPFEDIMSSLKSTINDYKYFTDFEKATDNTKDFRNELEDLNTLIGSPNIRIDFEKLVNDNPKVLKAIPILLAKREMFIKVLDVDEKEFRFDELNLSIDDYSKFMEETGIFYLLENNKINSLIDYVVGIEVGLDSNARKNRSGVLFANLIESFIKKSIHCHNYFKEISTNSIRTQFGIDIDPTNVRANKIFDFAIKTEKYLYLIEANFYSTSGSKLNETARSYKNLSIDLMKYENVKFIWITDGRGWVYAKSNLNETYRVIEHLYTIVDLEKNVLDELD